MDDCETDGMAMTGTVVDLFALRNVKIVVKWRRGYVCRFTILAAVSGGNFQL